MKKLAVFLVMFLFSSCAFANEGTNLSADEALVKLKDGNKRFVEYKMAHPDESLSRRMELTQGQHPFVAILSCSDSRVPTEIIFDQGLGDVFVIRNAGNVLDEHVLGSIEYAVEHLGVNLVVVMGHESCGAVGAAMKKSKDTRCILSLEKAIAPACEACKKEHKFTYENVIKKHASLDVENIKKDKCISEYVCKHQLKVIPAYYNIKSGVVDFVE